MHSIHFNELHFPKGPNLRLLSISAVWMFSACLAMFAVFTFMGGSEFSDNMGGSVGLAFLVIGLLVSGVLAFIERNKSTQ